MHFSNLAGTTSPKFKLGKTGPTLFGSDSAPGLLDSAEGDFWFDKTAGALKIRTNDVWVASDSVNFEDVTGQITAEQLSTSTPSSGKNYLNQDLEWDKTGLYRQSGYLLVQSVADLPAAVSGVHTLPANTLVEVAGNVNIGSNAIAMSAGTMIRGKSATLDGFISTNASGVIRATNIGTVFLKEFFVISPAGPALSITNNTTVGYFVCMLVGFYDCASIGTVSGFEGQNYINCYTNQTPANLATNRTGVTITGTTSLVYFQGCIFDDINSGSCITLASGLTASLVDINTNFYKNLSNTSVLTVVAGSTVTRGKYVSNLGTSFTNVTIAGVTVSSVNWQFKDNSFIRDSRAVGQVYRTTEYTFTIASSNVFYKLPSFSTAGVLNERYTVSDGRLTYTGADTVVVSPTAILSIGAASNNQNFTIQLRKNGALIPGSEIIIRVQTGSARYAGSTTTVVEMSQNDFLEIYVANTTSNANLIVDTVSLKAI